MGMYNNVFIARQGGWEEIDKSTGDKNGDGIKLGVVNTQYSTNDVLWCAPEACIILSTSVTLINSKRKKKITI